ncbi:MAG: hypothetical protein KGV43_01955 [Arcobacter sp.]|nr:hypothetical protein [Arcobacter sp.]
MIIDTNTARIVTIPNTNKIDNNNNRTEGDFSSFLDKPKQEENLAGFENDITADFKSLRFSDPEGLLRVNRSIEYFDRLGSFDRLNLEDAKAFREIFADNIISEKELDKLSFKQVQKLDEFIWDGRNVMAEIRRYFTYEGGAEGMLKVSRTTLNDKFNQSLVNTVRNMDNSKVNDFVRELKRNLVQMLSGEPILPSFRYSSSSAGKFDELKHLTKNIDYGQFLDVYLPQLANMIEGSNKAGNMTSEQYKEEKLYLNTYENLKENYNKL